MLLRGGLSHRSSLRANATMRIATQVCVVFVLLVEAVAVAPEHVALSTDNDAASIQKALGEYSIVGDAFGSPLYRRDCANDGSFCPTKFLYKSATKGLWTVTGSSANVEKGKGTIISTVTADSPVGLRYKVYTPDQHIWILDGASPKYSLRVLTRHLLLATLGLT